MRTFLLIILFAGIGYVAGRQHGMQEQAQREAVLRERAAAMQTAPARRPENNPANQELQVQGMPAKPEKIVFYGQQSVKRAEDGHYYLDGSINGVAVRFMIDTGASLSVISSDLAKQAGITECLPAEFRTAMGVDRDVCIAKVQRIDFGQFSFQDVYIGVSKNLTGDSLLGMNVLKDLEIKQSGTMLILEN